MTFAVPIPFISHEGKACIALDRKTLFGRVVQHLARQWEEHDVIGVPYTISTVQWNSVVSDGVRARMLERLRENLFSLATRDGLSIVGFGPVLLLPLDHQIPSDASGLARLLQVTPKTLLPVSASAEHSIRLLYQQAHVVAPMTAEEDAAARRLTSRGNVG